MKKLLAFLTLALCLTACSESDIVESPVKPEKLAGEWVYDSPKDGLWEIIKFTESGVFYYSNDWAIYNISNDRNDGRYTISDKHLSGNYYLNGQSMVVEMDFLVLNDYEFMAEFKAIGQTFTYARLLSRVSMKLQGEKTTPDYRRLVDADILGYSSHDRNIATVDNATGEITAVAASGRTYIDVATTKGTAVVEVTVYNEQDPFGDYLWAIGMTLDQVQQRLGDVYLWARQDFSGISYHSTNLAVETERYFTSTIDDTHVQTVQLELNDRLTESQVVSILKSKYGDLGKSSYGNYQYVNSDGTVFVIYDPKENTVSIFRQVEWPDFDSMFGLTKQDVKDRMEMNGHSYLESYDTYSHNGSESYLFGSNNDKVFAAEFVFNTDDVMSEYYLYLTEDTKYPDDTSDFLSSRGFTYDKKEHEANAGLGIPYYNSSKTKKATYRVTSHSIAITDLTQKPFLPVILGNYWKGIGMTVSQIASAYGSDYDVDGNVMRYIFAPDASVYVSYVLFSRSTAQGKIDLVNVFVRSSVTSATVIDYLDNLYTKLDSGTNANGPYHRWINGASRSTSTLIVTYYSDYGVIVYQHPSTAS